MDMAITIVVVDTKDMLAARVFAFPAFIGSGGFFDDCLLKFLISGDAGLVLTKWATRLGQL